MKWYLSIILLILPLLLLAEPILLGDGQNDVTVLSSSPTETILEFKVGSFDARKTMIGSRLWYQISLPREGVRQDKGKPELPVFNRSIIIPSSSAANIEVYDLQWEDLDLSIAPSKGVITRDQAPELVPYTFSDTYNRDAFYPELVASLGEPYILRDFRGITVQTNPIAYNPVAGILRVYTSYKIRISTIGTDDRNALTRESSDITRDFLPIYETHFVNWNSQRYTPVSDSFGKLLVICHTNYMTTIVPYVNWKRQKGIDTELVQWSSIGTTAAQLQTYIQTRYNADPSLAYVQLVGDAPQIPSLSSGGGGSDPTFSLVAGSDNYPDIFIGRFSAENTTQLTAQINKAIVYERDLTTADTWLSRALGIASAEGGGSQGDNGESDITHMNLIRTDLLNYGYSSVDQIYDPGASASTVTTNVNAGRGFINYVGHGSDTSWVTTGFSNTNASALTNGNKTPFIMDVACVNGNFVSQTCLAEAWMRNATGGAVAIYASTINQSWNSPMHAQDEFTDLLVAQSKTTTGGLYYNASCKMMDTYGNTSGSDGVNMFKTWHIFGDAALTIRTKTPQIMTVSHPSQFTIGTTNLSINTGVANALAALSYNNTIIAKVIANSAGTATLTLLSPPSGTVTYTLTVTAFNRVTYIGSIQQIPGDGPYLSVVSNSFSDSNNNLAEYNETGRFSTGFKNTGTAAASNITATLSCSTPGITITDATETISTLAAGVTVTRTNAFSFNVAANITDQLNASFTITMTSSSTSWVHNFTQVFGAPDLTLGSLTINDSSGNNNGRLDPGETVMVTVGLSNVGAATSLSGSSSLACSDPSLTIISGTSSFNPLAAGGSTLLSFSLSASADISIGSLVTLNVSATAGSYSDASNENVYIGLILEDFESAGFNSYQWVMGGTLAWTIDGTDAYDGSRSAKSGTITHSQNSSMQTTRNLAASGNLSFWYKVSSESGYDYLKFYIDGAQQGQWSGTVGWTQANYTLSAGTRVLKWEYSKDSIVSNGSDCAWIDRIIFPASTSPSSFNPPQNFTAVGGNGYVSLSWQAPLSGSPTGYKVFRNGSLLTSVTALSYTDGNVLNETTYTYYLKAVYSGGESDPTQIVNATPTSMILTEVILGTGTAATSTSDASPVSVFYRSLHNQMVYTAAELISAGITGPRTITQIGFNITGLPLVTMPNFIIRMGHTTALNVSSWISSGLTQYWSSTSYRPSDIGWNMYILSTPFQWNGVDNIVVDTAYGLFSEAYSYSGQVQYTSVTNGYRYIRSDGYDQTSVFTGGSDSSSRPNLKLVLVSPAETAEISVNPSSISASLAPDSNGSANLSINNTGAENLIWSVSREPISPARNAERSLTGSTVTCSAIDYIPGQNQNWVISVYNGSDDAEWVRSISLQLPSTVILNSVTNLTGGNYELTPSPTFGTGVTLTWTGVNLTDSSWGVITGGQTATSTLNVRVIQSAFGTLAIPWTINGDEYGSNPHTIDGTIYLTAQGATLSSDWWSVTPSSGTITPGESLQLTVNLNSAGMIEGNYSDTILISSNAGSNPSLNVPISLTVAPAQSSYPTSPRFIAEWEPSLGALIRYPFGLPFSMIQDLAADKLLYILCSAASQSNCTSSLTANGVNTSNVRYITAITDSYWTRDYGPWFIKDGEDALKIIDFPYNRPRPNDDAVPEIIANYLGIPTYDLAVTHTGGNIMTDGKGKAMSTSLVLEENSSMTQAQINQQMQNYLGITDYWLYEDPNNTYIDHIDCWAKLLDVDKVMIRRVPSSHAQYSAIENVVSLWNNQVSSYGTPYRVFRVDTPNDEPYSNAYINGTRIYVPQMGTSGDAAALQAYRSAMPGYEVSGYTYTSFEGTDAIHCRVNSIFDSQMITVSHTPVTEWISHNSINLPVVIRHSNPLVPDSTYVAYKIGSQGIWQKQTLNQLSGLNYASLIPAASYGDTLFYMISAYDTTGRRSTMPLCGRMDPFRLVINQAGALEAPANVSLNVSSNMITLSWDPIPGAQFYWIYASDNPEAGFDRIDSTTSPVWSQSISANSAKFFRVKASTTAN